MKAQALADHLADNPVNEDYKPLNTYFPDEEIQVRNQHAYCNMIEEEIDGEPWFHDIKEYIRMGVYPVQATRKQKRMIRRLASGFFFNGGVLYKRTPDLRLLRCMDARQATSIMTEENKVKVWLIQTIDGSSEQQRAEKLAVEEVFSRREKQAVIRLKGGVTITDNGSNLNSDLMKAMFETFKIKHKNSTAYRPQMNGAVEAANKNIKKILRKMIEKYKQWHEKLSFSLLGYRTTVRTSTGATPYMLVYGTEAVIPAEVEIPSLRVIQEAKLDDAEWVKNRYEQLALIDGKRMNVVCHGQLYQNRMSRAFNKRVKPRKFTPGQLVLKKIFPYQDEAKGKFSPNWQGPYMVHRVLTGGAFILAEMDREVWPKPINADAVKQYYI
ncbi:uncharacterized protein [Nicotiana sylvestris]|uniref:uncharacterized protein n=1 Tax=Nicotiana sylvestris TaxID=4096 RepID=UPI00388C77A8